MSIDSIGIIRELQQRLKEQSNLEQHRPIKSKNSLVGDDRLKKGKSLGYEKPFRDAERKQLHSKLGGNRSFRPIGKKQMMVLEDEGGANNDSQEFRNMERRQMTQQLAQKVGGKKGVSDNMVSKFAKFLRGQGFDDDLNTKQLTQLLQHLAPLEVQPERIEKFGTGKYGGSDSEDELVAREEEQYGNGQRRKMKGRALPFPGDIYDRSQSQSMPTRAKQGLTIYKAYIDSLSPHLSRAEKNVLWSQHKLQTLSKSNY